MAKIYFYLILLALFTFSYENIETIDKNKLEFTPEDLEGFITEFLKGAHIQKISESTIPCKNSFRQLMIDGADAIDELMNNKIWDGSVSVTEVLGSTSFVARNCTNSIDELSAQFYTYIQYFDSFQSWILNIKGNVSKNMIRLSLLSAQLVDELKKDNPDFPLIGGTLGQMAYYTLSSDTKAKSLKYLRSDPLAPAPMNEYVWIAFESAFEFLTNSKMVKEPVIEGCHNNLINMLLYQMDAYRNIQANSIQEGVFLTLDSFIFLKDILVNWTDTGLEIGENFNKVYQRISKNPEIVRKNFEEKLFHVVSGSAATYAQIYYKDIISLNKVFGALVYNTLVRNEA